MSPEPQTPPAEEPQVSLADHEAQFAPNGAAPAPPPEVLDDTPPFEEAEEPPPAAAAAPPRHKAKSQQGTAEDLAAIDELTKRIRTGEKELGIERKAGESQRVFNLRKQAEMIERLKAAPKAIPAPAMAAPPKFTPPPATSAFAETEPTQAQFMNAADPYAAFISAHAKWEFKKDNFDAAQATAKTEGERATKERQAQYAKWVNETEAAHVSRLTTFVTTNPTARQELETAGDLEITPIMYGAASLSLRGPEIMLEYARHPDLVDDLVIQTAGRPMVLPDGTVNPLVATLQRRLLSRLAVAPTGSTPAPKPIVVAPRPPNPVRTAPQPPPGTPPGDGASLKDHERFYGPKSRRQ